MTSAPSARRERTTEPPVEVNEPRAIRAWCMVYIPFDDGPGGGFELREMHMPLSAVVEYTERTWAPEIMAITTARLGSRVHACMHDLDSADRDTY